MVTRPEDMQQPPARPRAAVARWAEAGADLILGGHIHLPYVRSLHEAVSRAVARAWAVQAGTAVSSRVRGGQPNSVNVVRLGLV
jgi:UDP-2,3-diacylglucosamine pyrophosphatase LpxH